MTPVDLVLFAEHSVKVPEEFLTSKTPESKKWPVFAAHLIDFGAVFMGSVLLAAVYNHGMSFMMVTKGLKAAFTPDVIFTLSTTSLPFFLFSYFFFSFFMNHGQTWGMMTMKKRIHMKEQSFGEAFKWALWSTLLCFTSGLSYFVRKDLMTHFKAHDWLYHDFVAVKEASAIDLFECIDNVQEENQPEWKQAA